MSRALDELHRSEGPMGLLRALGLDQILTAEDDHRLWAAALARHWHAPVDADFNPAVLRFGVSRPVSDAEAPAVTVGRSGMVELEVWCFERIEGDRLRVVECRSQPALSFMGMLMGGDAEAATEHEASWVRDLLEVSRPSVDQTRALVHAGMTAPVNAGSGETRVWVRAEDGTWSETDEIVARWLA
jgi:hypothetical protein